MNTKTTPKNPATTLRTLAGALTLFSLAAALSMPTLPAAQSAEQQEKDQERAAERASDERETVVATAREIKMWNQRIDQFAAPFLNEFSKDEADRKYFEEARIKQLVLEQKTREALARLRRIGGYDSDMSAYRNITNDTGDVINKYMNELMAERKKISQIMTKVLKQVRDTAKTEQDPAKKKDLLDKAKRASDGWNRKLPVDPKKPLPEPPEQPGAKAKQPKKAQKKKK